MHECLLLDLFKYLFGCHDTQLFSTGFILNAWHLGSCLLSPGINQPNICKHVGCLIYLSICQSIIICIVFLLHICSFWRNQVGQWTSLRLKWDSAFRLLKWFRQQLIFCLQHLITCLSQNRLKRTFCHKLFVTSLRDLPLFRWLAKQKSFHDNSRSTNVQQHEEQEQAILCQEMSNFVHVCVLVSSFTSGT